MAWLIYINVILFCQIFIRSDGQNVKTSPEPTVFEIKGNAIPISTRIVGGQPTDIKTYPFSVSIQWRVSSRHHCGGTYILPRFILSAAHCMIRFRGYKWSPENPKFFVILAGSSNLWYSPTWQIALVDALFPHPQFSLYDMAHDIGLFRIKNPFNLSPYVNYGRLPSGQSDDLFKRRNYECTVIGWGKVSETSTSGSDVLRHVKVPIMPTQKCNQYFFRDLHPSQFCAGRKEGGVDACQGDSGGPLLCEDRQFGIVSWGYGCAAPHSPGVYIRVDYYLGWLQTTSMKHSTANKIFDNFSTNNLLFLVLMMIFLR